MFITILATSTVNKAYLLKISFFGVFYAETEWGEINRDPVAMILLNVQAVSIEIIY